MRKGLLVTLAIVTMLSAGCASTQARKTLTSGDPCRDVADVVAKAQGGKADSAAYDKALQTCTAGLAQTGVDPCIAADQLAQYKVPRAAADVKAALFKDAVAGCMEKSYYADPCADAKFFRGVTLDKTNPHVQSMWGEKYRKAEAACQASLESISFGFTDRYNDRCSEHNGVGLYNKAVSDCAELQPGVAADVIPAITPQGDRKLICDISKRAYASWYSGCGGRLGSIRDPFSADAKEAAKKRAERNNQIKEEEQYQTVCRTTNGDRAAYRNLEFAKKAKTACDANMINQASGALKAQLQRDCERATDDLSEVENFCWAERFGARFGRVEGVPQPLVGNRTSSGVACYKESVALGAALKTDGEFQAFQNFYRCSIDFFKSRLEQGEAAKGTAGLSEADKLKKENEELEKQLKALKGGN